MMPAPPETPLMKHLFLLLGLLILAGCNREPGGASPPRPPAHVVVAEARRQPISETLSLVGTLAANETVEIKSEIDGTIIEIGFDEGQRVEEGSALFQLDDSKLAASLAEAEASFRLSRLNYERNQALFRERLVSQQEYDQSAATFQANEASLQLKRRQLKDTRVVAPFSGVLGARQVSPGQVIPRNQTLGWLIDLDPVKVEVHVPERFLAQLQPRQLIELSVAAFPGRTFAGDVFFIAPFVDPATRTALVKARLPNPKGELRPGMFASLELTLITRENAVVIPEMALSHILEQNRARLYTVNGQMTAQLKTVTLGVRLRGAVEIVEGLEPGEKVIVEGYQKVSPGAPVVISPAN
jgi:membrane fusion protein, multidrug efflux system